MVVHQTTTALVTTIINKTVATGSIVPRKEIEIKPQVSGVVAIIYVEAGDTVKYGDLLTKVKIIPDMGEMIFKGKVDESEVGKIRPGMHLILAVGAIENETFDATLEYISPKGAEEKGAIKFEIKASIKLKQTHFLRAGYSANADIVLDRRDNVLAVAVDESLLQFDGDKPFVEIESKPHQFEKRAIRVGLSDGISIEITAGLTETDKIKIWNKPIQK